MSDKQTKIQPVFEVTVKITMEQAIDDGVSVSYDGDCGAYIDDVDIQQAVQAKVVDRVAGLFDRAVLNRIQELAQAEIKDQLGKKIPLLVDAALKGPASKHPDMTLEEVLRDAVDKQFIFPSAVGKGRSTTLPSAPVARTSLDQAMVNEVNRRMKSFEVSVKNSIYDLVNAKAAEFAQGFINQQKSE